jgi:hypothetical protein
VEGVTLSQKSARLNNIRRRRFQLGGKGLGDIDEGYGDDGYKSHETKENHRTGMFLRV